VKFLCVECDEVMALQERQLPGDGTLAAIYLCSGCTREIALLTNPMETRIVSSMGVKIGGRTVPEQPMETVRTNLEGGRDDAFDAAPQASEPPAGSAPPEPEGAAAAEWEEAADLSVFGDAVLLIKEQGLPPPEVGVELLDEAGEVLAELELAWRDQRLAVVEDLDSGARQAFERLGWIVLAGLDETTARKLTALFGE